MAGQICDIMCGFGMDAKIVLRKKSFVVYLKAVSYTHLAAFIMEYLGLGVQAHYSRVNRNSDEKGPPHSDGPAAGLWGLDRGRPAAPQTINGRKNGHKKSALRRINS